MVKVGNYVQYQAQVVRPDTTHKFDVHAQGTRFCIVASGKANVQIGDVSFVIGQGGLFKIQPGDQCRVENEKHVDVRLQIFNIL
jgi:mannose-6-phosphate isomerase-like protein (cupin superfamily)